MVIRLFWPFVWHFGRPFRRPLGHLYVGGFSSLLVLFCSYLLVYRFARGLGANEFGLVLDDLTFDHVFETFLLNVFHYIVDVPLGNGVHAAQTNNIDKEIYL